MSDPSARDLRGGEREEGMEVDREEWLRRKHKARSDDVKFTGGVGPS